MNTKKALLLLLAVLLGLAMFACAGEPNGNDYTEPAYTTITTSDENENDFLDFSPVFVNDQNVAGATVLLDDEWFPVHVSLMPVAEALGVQVNQEDHVALKGLNGPVSFVVGSYDFYVNGEAVTLNAPALEVDGVLYVPFLFFRDVFGAGSVTMMGGEVRIATHAPGDMF